MLTKVCLVKAMVFPVIMYGYKSWTIKKADRWRIDAFELRCWRRLLRVPLTARRSNQSILKIRPGCSLEGLMLKLKLQYFGHLMWRTDSFEKSPWCWERLRAGGEGDDRGWDGWMALLTRWTWVWVDSGSWWWTGRPSVLRFMGSQGVRHDLATEQREKWSYSVVSNSATPWIVACKVPLSMGFARHKYWSELPFPSPEDLPNPGTEPRSPALQADSLLAEPGGKSTSAITQCKSYKS